MKTEDATETRANALDVELLDVLAELESLLRTGREIQRESLRLRGVPSPVTREQRRKSAVRVQRLCKDMAVENRALSDIVGQLCRTAEALVKSTA